MPQTIDGYDILAMLPLTLVSFLLAKLWTSRSTVTFGQAFVSLTSVNLILSVTLVGRLLSLIILGRLRSFDLLYWGDTNSFSWLFDKRLWSDALHVDPEWILNVGLFFPAGFIISGSNRKIVPVVLGLVALSIVIEFLQRVYLLGASDPADIIANGLGASIGVASAKFFTRISDS